MVLANIVSNEKIDVPYGFKVIKDITESAEGKPTLIIGYDYVNKRYPNFDISNIKIANNLYWTFKRTEKRDKYVSDLLWFESKVYKELIADISYIFIDPIQYNKHSLIKIIKKILKSKEIISYVFRDMIYIYFDKLIFGVDLKLLKYIGLDIVKIKTKIKAISKSFLDDDKILIEYKKTVDILDDQVRYIPFLYSIKNE